MKKTDKEIMDMAKNCERMTNEEDRQFLRILIRNTEARYIDYGKTMEMWFKDRPMQKQIEDLQKELNENRITQKEFDELRIKAIDFDVWYKGLLRENRNTEARVLKGLREEQEYQNAGMSPPYVYPKKKNEDDKTI